MFRLLGALLGIYMIFAVVQGRVHAKRRAWGECIERAIESHRFWTVIAIYAALAVALATLF